MCNDDERAAANITVTLSGQIIAAALAMLAIEGAVLSFVYSNRITDYRFFVLIIVAAVSFISSIYRAGKGITALRNQGYEGNWELKSTKNHFNLQAILCLIGLSCFFGSAFFIGQPKADKLTDEITLIKQEMSTLKNEMECIRKSRNISADERQAGNPGSDSRGAPPASTQPGKRVRAGQSPKSGGP